MGCAAQAPSDINSNWNCEQLRITEDGKFLRSSFPGIWKPSKQRGNPHLSPQDWMQAKRELDDIGDYWRVYDKLYDLTEFISNHPGGPEWISMTRGTDITEAFEASHMVNVNKVEAILAKYYVKNAEEPRNSPYTFKEDGFYKTLKRRVEPILKENGTSPSRRILITQDLLAFSFLVLSIIGAAWDSIIVSVVAGLLLGMAVTGAHNFLHIRNNFRRFYFDLGAMSSHDFRITHHLSHHLYTNTTLDYEIAVFEPFLEMLPSRPKTLFQRYGSIFYAHLIYAVLMPIDLLRRTISWFQGKTKPRPENFIVFLELLLYISIAPSILTGIRTWFAVLLVASYWIGLVGINAAHHHPDCFHDGDAPRKEPDFGHDHGTTRQNFST